MQILPDGTVQITNSQTGETKVVQPDDLAQYGPNLPQQYLLMKNQGGASLTPKQPSGGIPGAQTPSVEPPPTDQTTDPVQLRWQRAFEQTSDPTQKEKIATAWKTSRGFELYGSSTETQASRAKTATEKEKTDKLTSSIKDTLQSVLSDYQRVPDIQKGVLKGKAADIPIVGQFVSPEARAHEQGLKGIAPIIKELVANAGSGIRVTQSEINNWSNLLPSTGKSDRENWFQIQRLDGLMKSKIGVGFDAEYLKYFENRAKGAPNTESIQPNIVGNAINDIVGMVKSGVLQSPPVDVARRLLDPKGTNEAYKQAGIGLVQDLGKTTGVSVDQSGVHWNPEAALVHDWNHPVQTLMWFTMAKSLLLGKGGAPETGAPKAGVAPITKAFSESASELVTGGGTKELIAKNSKIPGVESLSKTLLKNDIFSSLTDKGRIASTQDALTKVGTDLADTYKASSFEKGIKIGDTEIKNTGAALSESLKTYLKKLYGESQSKVVNDVVKNISQQGKYDIFSGEKTISPKDMWETAKNGETFGGKAFNLPNNGPLMKAIAEDTSRFLRKTLYDNIPEARPKATEYGNLRTYFDDVLSDPAGVQVKDIGGLVKLFSANFQKLSTALFQKIYNFGEKAGGQAASKPPVSGAPAAPVEGQPLTNPPTGVPFTPPDETAGITTKGQGSPYLKRDLRFKALTPGAWKKIQ